MSDSEVHVVAIVTPAPGKTERLKELFTNLANEIKTQEANVIQYQMFEQVNSEKMNVIVVEECYKDQATFDAHFATPWFTTLREAILSEGLVAVPLDIKTIKPFAGFAAKI